MVASFVALAGAGAGFLSVVSAGIVLPDCRFLTAVDTGETEFRKTGPWCPWPIQKVSPTPIATAAKAKPPIGLVAMKSVALRTATFASTSGCLQTRDRLMVVHAVPNCRWIAFSYMPFFDHVASEFTQTENSPLFDTQS